MNRFNLHHLLVVLPVGDVVADFAVHIPQRRYIKLWFLNADFQSLTDG